MTAVIAINYLYGFLVLADTRVTFSDGTCDDDEILRRLLELTLQRAAP